MSSTSTPPVVCTCVHVCNCIHIHTYILHMYVYLYTVCSFFMQTLTYLFSSSFSCFYSNCSHVDVDFCLPLSYGLAAEMDALPDGNPVVAYKRVANVQHRSNMGENQEF